ncbi:cleavage stimulation factor subunit 1 isoform X3 [Apus apus]|uniref:cleavage stimulation factor subunit 1 isoform X3 n=1 Tax=Apus apus TaxID=8895 RepID=UPI0021F8F88D|nr:cleavage stimulation factor subunit 1 isoform X3 [Apus apus]
MGPPGPAPPAPPRRAGAPCARHASRAAAPLRVAGPGPGHVTPPFSPAESPPIDLRALDAAALAEEHSAVPAAAAASSPAAAAHRCAQGSGRHFRGRAREAEGRHGMENDDSAVQYAIGRSDTVAPGTGIDLEFDADVQTMSPEASEYETCYVTSHKGPCRVATYSRDGQLIATGSADASIKILDTERMLAKSAMPIEVMMNETAQQNMENHPVIRTLYDHVDEVTCLAFHPTEQILASGSRDYTLKLFDYSKPSAKRAFKYIQEAEMLRSISFHPSGDFILVGTQHPTLRLYDINTFQCFVSCNPQDQHTDAICSVNYNASANMYVTGSKDGCIKLWDGVSNRCITTFEKAHDGAEVCSAIFSKNSKYILSSGKDSVAKLWEISTGRTLVKYTENRTCFGAVVLTIGLLQKRTLVSHGNILKTATAGAGLSGRQVHRTQAVFNHTEDYVLLPDERTISLCCWDSRTAERRNLLSLGHNSIVRCIVHSPTNPGFMTCSDDYRARFWYRRSTTD